MERRQKLFDSQKGKQEDGSLVSTTVSYLSKSDSQRKKGELRQLGSDEKMVCALRKVLAQLSDEAGNGTRYFVVGSQVRVLESMDAPGAKKGEPGSYFRRGRAKIGVSHATGEATYKMVEFSLNFRDTVDDRGLPDVSFVDPTNVDELPSSTDL